MTSSPESERRIIERLLRENRALRVQVSTLTDLSYVDPVTGLKNRRYYDERLGSEVQLCRRRGEPLSVIVADVDDFKDANDTHGHTVGDEVLRWVAGTLEAAVREHDVVCRVGGDEFALVLTGVDAHGAERLRDRVALRLSQGAPLRLPPGCRVTLSMGASTLMVGDRRTAGDLFEDADAAMYADKASRKNTRTIG
ncbi:MAG: diguanylate cyclase (GGDEF)-like protein [Myxococcota bacterium]